MIYGNVRINMKLNIIYQYYQELLLESIIDSKLNLKIGRRS